MLHYHWGESAQFFQGRETMASKPQKHSSTGFAQHHPIRLTPEPV
jgi:hypothetical protein